MKEREKFCLLIRDFPSDLAERCLSASGEKVLTRAVLSMLRHYFVMQKQFSAMKLQRDDLQSDVDLILGYWKMQRDLEKRKSDVEKILSDPNRFYLHGD